MAITNGYCTLAELKSRLGISVADVDDDSVLEAVIESTSRLIDDFCNRRFYTTAEDETRYYTAQRSDYILPDDIISVTTLATDDDGDRVYENTWQATDYDLEPYNAALDGQPYTKISAAPEGDYTFPKGVAKGVKVTGKFGYAATAPKPVQEACLIQASRLFRRKDAPFGVTGAAEFGTTTLIARLDPDVKMLLESYRRIVVG